MTKRSVTMSDVARQLGISRSAVSFALNNEAQVSRETRERVIAKAAELGYRPNAGARALAGQKTDLFGLVTDIVSTPFAGDLIAGAQEWFWGHGKSLLIAGTATPERPDARSIEMMLEHRVGGIMIATTWNRAIDVPAALENVPVVLVHCFDALGERPSIIPDEEQGGREAAQMLLARGRRRIAMINLPEDLVAAQGRRLGFEKALVAAGMAIDPASIVTSGPEPDSAYDVARALLAAGDIDGVFCANDRIAMGTYDAARDLGLRIPEDLSIVGFDNQETIAKYLRPALSTVALPFREMGRRGAELLTRASEDIDRKKIVISCPPIARNSV
ncbi:LacI family DNA-binding transcriptional regulator [Microbacterium stercoris]|uniref:LacI family DNA-binding transcriptional regulator n=1 Tax=Microbacterium stercoris TaxID=2820289 RepID=A0A939QHB3_9MICO|nr:LacI family DNA-binding transcriptional regulator [Microbacterium stercoris]MBO3662808.1 LacI family DNA-binding transcriptional regulator [Microbacterium stercoris]